MATQNKIRQAIESTPTQLVESASKLLARFMIFPAAIAAMDGAIVAFKVDGREYVESARIKSGRVYADRCYTLAGEPADNIV